MKRESGQLMIIVALGMVVFLGFAALAVDLAHGYSERRNAQNAADAAALAGIRLVRADPSVAPASVYSTMQAVAGNNGGAVLLPGSTIADSGAVFLGQNPSNPSDFKYPISTVLGYVGDYSDVYAVRARTKIDYNTFFGGALKISQLTSGGRATAMSFDVGEDKVLPMAFRTRGGCTPNFGLGGTPPDPVYGWRFFDSDPEAPGGFGWIEFNSAGSDANTTADWIQNGFPPTEDYDFYTNYFWDGDWGETPVADPDPGECEDGYYDDGNNGLDWNPPPPKSGPPDPPYDLGSNCDDGNGGCDLKNAPGATTGSDNPLPMISWLNENSGLGNSVAIRNALEALEGHYAWVFIHNKLDKGGANGKYQIVGMVGFRVTRVEMTSNPKEIWGFFDRAIVPGGSTGTPTSGPYATFRLVPD